DLVEGLERPRVVDGDDVRPLAAHAARVVGLGQVDLAVVGREQRGDHEADARRARAQLAEQLSGVAGEERRPGEEDVALREPVGAGLLGERRDVADRLGLRTGLGDAGDGEREQKRPEERRASRGSDRLLYHAGSRPSEGPQPRADPYFFRRIAFRNGTRLSRKSFCGYAEFGSLWAYVSWRSTRVRVSRGVLEWGARFVAASRTGCPPSAAPKA